jgi:hypothetical protein
MTTRRGEPALSIDEFSDLSIDHTIARGKLGGVTMRRVDVTVGDLQSTGCVHADQCSVAKTQTSTLMIF